MNLDFKKIILAIVLSGFWSCNSGFDEQLSEFEQKLVIDGFIEQNEYPRVYLTLSSGFYSPLDSASLIEMIVPTARVAVSDGEKEEVLTLFRNPNIYPPFYYQGTDLVGEVGKTYRLEVTSRGATYTASTTIPHPVELDSLWFEYNEGSNSRGRLWLSFNDDPSVPNYYRIFTRKESDQSRFVPAVQSAVADEFFADAEVQFPLLEFFVKGDSISIKFCSIDEDHYNFWRTVEREQLVQRNPFGTVGNPILSNIEGTPAALGIWGGYGVTRDYFIVK